MKTSRVAQVAIKTNSNGSYQQAPVEAKSQASVKAQRELATAMLNPLRLPAGATANASSFIQETQRMLAVLEGALQAGQLEYVERNLDTVTDITTSAIANFTNGDHELETQLTTRLDQIEDMYLEALQQAEDRTTEQFNGQQRQTASEAYDKATKRVGELEQILSQGKLLEAALSLPDIEKEVGSLENHSEKHLERSKIDSLKEQVTEFTEQVNHFVEGLETQIETKIAELNKLITEDK